MSQPIFTTRTLVLMATGIALNMALGQLAELLKLPIFLDSLGTMLVAVLCGPWIGGLTGLITNLLWGLIQGPTAAFFAPVAAIIPGAATSAVLIYVGVLMLQGLKNVNFDDMDQMLPVSIMLIGMPISGSIGHAIGLGLISYTVVKLLSGKAKDVSVLTYVISALFLIKFFAVV